MKKYLAEFIGTFVLVFGGVGSAVLAGQETGNVGVALAFGLALLAMVCAIGPISGYHVNRAVTLGLFFAKKLRGPDVLGYWVAQCLGAIVAAAVLLTIAKGAPQGYDAAVSGLGANGYNAHSPAGYGLLAAFLCETILTAFLVFTVLGSTDVLAPVGFAVAPFVGAGIAALVYNAIGRGGPVRDLQQHVPLDGDVIKTRVVGSAASGSITA